MGAARRVIKREVAKQDLDAIADYLTGEASLEVGLRFLERAEEACRKLADMPLMGSPRDFGNERLKGMRTWLVPGFQNHMIFYFPLEDGIEVLRVLHGAQDLERIFGRESGNA